MTKSRERAEHELPGIDWQDVEVDAGRLDQAPIVWAELESESTDDEPESLDVGDMVHRQAITTGR